MHRTLERLYRDHAHFHGLIDILEDELSRITAGEFFDTGLLLELVDYFKEYADTIHHPIEDQLYEQQLARSDSGREPMEQLLGHHLILGDMNRQLREALQRTQQGSAEAATSVASLGHLFITEQRDHMRSEESRAFPLLTTSLSDEAFALAAAAIPAVDDPLLDNRMRGRYPTLFERLSTLP